MSYQALKGQKALVTGARSGIGLGVARALGAAGADVVMTTRYFRLTSEDFPRCATRRVADHLKAWLGA